VDKDSPCLFFLFLPSLNDEGTVFPFLSPEEKKIGHVSLLSSFSTDRSRRYVRYQ